MKWIWILFLVVLAVSIMFSRKLTFPMFKRENYHQQEVILLSGGKSKCFDCDKDLFTRSECDCVNPNVRDLETVNYRVPKLNYV